jgi:hypothetical protein
MLIDRYLPRYDAVEKHRILVRAPAPRCYQAILDLDLARSRPVRILFALRGLPLLARRRPWRRTATMKDLLEAGFVVLGEEAGTEIVLGLVGRFWRPTGGIRRTDPVDFATFEDPGWAKAAWNFRVSGHGPGRSAVDTETRVLCTDRASRRAFLRYWRIVGKPSGFIRNRALHLIRADAERP